LNSVITTHNLTEKPSTKALMGQVSEKKILGPPSGRPGCNLDDNIKERDPYKKGDQESKQKKKEKE